MDQMTRKLADLQNAILTGRGTQEFHDLKIVNVSGINQEV